MSCWQRFEDLVLEFMETRVSELLDQGDVTSPRVIANVRETAAWSAERAIARFQAENDVDSLRKKRINSWISCKIIYISGMKKTESLAPKRKQPRKLSFAADDALIEQIDACASRRSWDRRDEMSLDEVERVVIWGRNLALDRWRAQHADDFEVGNLMG
jgi:hypothetical protein